jgi:hypothetical protein
LNKDWRTAVIETYSNYSNTEDGEFEVMSKMWNSLQLEIARAENEGKSRSKSSTTHPMNSLGGKSMQPVLLVVQAFQH